MEFECPECGRESDTYRGFAIHYGNSHEGNPLVALLGRETLASMYEEMSENALAQELDVGRRTVQRALRAADIDRRGQSEAEKLKNEQMSEEERREQTRRAREEYFEKYGDGGYIEQWTRENPEKHREVARKAAPLGAPAREENGMAGVTGEDHPNWRGGKSLYDAVVIALPGPAWWTLRDRHRGDECEMCGTSDVELHLHHIVPVLVGGTNEPWNFLTLCEECHTATEWRTREITEPVLVE